MNRPRIVALERCGALPRELVGGKAQGLGRLLEAGQPVPCGFCLTSVLLEGFVRSSAVGHAVERALDAVERRPIDRGRALAAARRALLETPLPGDLRATIAVAAGPLLAEGTVAVRSSAPAEDGHGSTFAGVYHSELDVEDLEALETAIRRCWASLFSERAAFYGRGTLVPAMAVIVQCYVRPLAAGVLFTADPLTGERTPVLEGAFGTPDAVTAGRGADFRVALGREPLPDELAAAAAALGDAARAAREVVGSDAELEWALGPDGLAVLQARPLVPARAAQPKAGFAAQEDVEDVYGLALGACERLFMRQLQKKVWLRRACREAGLPTFAIVYAVYGDRSLPALAEWLDGHLSAPAVRIDWGGHSVLTERSRVIDALRRGAEANVVGPGLACAQIGEVLPAETTGFAAQLPGGRVHVEAFPNGLPGIKEGALAAASYSVGPAGDVLRREPASYGERAGLDLRRDVWRVEQVDPYVLDLGDELLREIADATRELTRRFGEIRLEWYVFDGRFYVKDASLESSPLDVATPASVLSPGAAEGPVFRIADIGAYDALARDFNVSVVSHAEDGVGDVDVVEVVRERAERSGPPVIVAEYPSIGLIPLVPHVAAFVFRRGTLLSHTAIVLREHGIPAVIAPGAADTLQDGNLVHVSSAGAVRLTLDAV